MDKRLSNIDFARGIAIICVTLGHVLGSYRLTDSPLFYWVYSFELPLFFIASGMIAEIINKDHGKAYCYMKKQATSILYPFFIFSIVLSAIYSITALRDGVLNSVIRFVKCLIITFSGIGMGALWFLPTFFFACVTAYLVYNKFCKDRDLLLCTMATIIVIVSGSILSYITEYTASKEYMFLKGSDYISIILWNILSQLSRSLVGASLILIGRIFVKIFRIHRKTDFVMRGGYLCMHRKSSAFTRCSSWLF